jgi:transcriptional regulator with XRE-family HTH domain
MDFGERLAALRKEKGLTQQALAELINLHVIQVRRYESGASQPTLDVIRRLAVALQVSADVLIFGADERGPDGDLRLQFEAISKFAPNWTSRSNVIKAASPTEAKTAIARILIILSHNEGAIYFSYCYTHNLISLVSPPHSYLNLNSESRCSSACVGRDADAAHRRHSRL